jgi:hypothetical protein
MFCVSVKPWRIDMQTYLCGSFFLDRGDIRGLSLRAIQGCRVAVGVGMSFRWSPTSI